MRSRSYIEGEELHSSASFQCPHAVWLMQPTNRVPHLVDCNDEIGSRLPLLLRERAGVRGITDRAATAHQFCPLP